MIWEEIIRLRSTDRDHEALKSELQKLINKAKKEEKKQKISAYRRSLIDTDFCIRIVHDSDTVENGGSALGLRLVSALRTFGLVDHSIWTKMPGISFF